MRLLTVITVVVRPCRAVGPCRVVVGHLRDYLESQARLVVMTGGEVTSEKVRRGGEGGVPRDNRLKSVGASLRIDEQ